MRVLKAALPHLLVVGLSAVLTWWWVRPLIGSFGTAIPGPGAGDNLTFVWNLWWTRYALAHGHPLLWSPLLLYPFGADLTLHTHTLLPALAVSFVANPLAAQNLLVCSHLFLNFACMYALAYRETGHAGAALVGALIFGWSPYVSARLAGHFNLVAVWVIPLASLVAIRARERRTLSSGALLGAVLGAIAYVDYYYFVYAVLLACLLAVTAGLRPQRREKPAGGRLVAQGIMTLIGVALVAAAVAGIVRATGGGVWHIAGRVVSMRTASGPLAIAWLSGMMALVTWQFRTWRATLMRSDLSRFGVPLLGASLALGLVLAPLAVRATALVGAGGYVTPEYRWRSAPAGIDVMSLFAGNPYSMAYGHLVRPAYERADVDLIEQVGWLGPGVLGLCIACLWRRSREGPGRRWVVPLMAFGIWAAGPFLQIAGHGSPLWLPAVLLRWVPFVANARIPARAIVVVYLACAMLAAFGSRRLLEDRRRRPLFATLVGLVLLDYAPARMPITFPSRPATIERLAAGRVSGAVLEVPFGLRDGFGEAGSLDPQSMWFQTIHQRAIAGGFVARLPRDTADRYRQLPVLGSLLRLSSGETLTDAEIEGDRLVADQVSAQGFGYVLVNRARSAAALEDYLDRVLPSQPIAEDADYTLYEVTAPH
jgi:hypothetical protein